MTISAWGGRASDGGDGLHHACNVAAGEGCAVNDIAAPLAFAAMADERPWAGGGCT